MNTSQLKSYAPAARRSFIAAVSAQAAVLGITDKETAPATVQGDVLLIAGAAFPKALDAPRKRLTARIRSQGFHATMEAIAYTWFNRFAAIRYMELHGYLEHGYRVLSGQGTVDSGQWDRPEILEHAADVDLPGLDRAQIIELKLDGTKDEELYRLLLKAQCNALHQAMPFLFEPIGGADELLLPANLLHTDSLVRQMVEEIDEDLWQDIEIIGWLYQFYISEKKDQVIGKVVKSEDIPAATQLFTPNWIVKYMVQNSLGAQWLATYPHSPLKGQMEYYIEPAEQTDEVKAQLAAITPKSLNPEELTLIDPACGSGHILVEAYDLFKAIYLERGYRQRDVAKLILEKNLFGLDIDGRAAQLTGFALMMKGRADDRRLLEAVGSGQWTVDSGERRGVRLNVMALVDSGGVGSGQWLVDSGVVGADGLAGAVDELVALFEHATTFGSLIQVPEGLAGKLAGLRRLSEVTSLDLFVSGALKRLGPLVRQAVVLAARYDVLVANPPYMGGKYMNASVKTFAKDNFPKSKSDLFAVSTERFLRLAKPAGFVGLMTPFTWMFLKSYEVFRALLLEAKTLCALVQPEYHAFFDSAYVPVCTFVLRNSHTSGYLASFIKLSDFYGAELQPQRTLEAIRKRDCEWFYEARPDDFRRVPGSPVAYWLTEETRLAFQRHESLSTVAAVRQGLATADDGRFLRQWHEVSALADSRAACRSPKWFPFTKGGSFRRWFGNEQHVVNWSSDGRELRSFGRSVIRNSAVYEREAISWTLISTGLPAFRYVPMGRIFGHKGPVVVFDSSATLEFFLCFLNSKVCTHFLRATSQTLGFEVGQVAQLPTGGLPSWSDSAQLGIDYSRVDWNAYERSWDFQTLPILSASSDPTIESSYTAWITQNRITIAEMKRLEEENNRLFIDAYGLQDELTPDVPIEQITLTVNPAYRYGKTVDSGQWTVDSGFGEELEARFRRDTMEELISYAIGCMMGRYRLDRPGLIYAHSGNERFWQIYEGVNSEQWSGNSEELSGSDRLAEVDGSGGAGVSDDQGVPEGRALRADQSSSAGGGVDSVQHRGRSGSTVHQGVQELPFNRNGLSGRGGDPDHDRGPSGLRQHNPGPGDHGVADGDLQDAPRPKKQAALTKLSTPHCPLSTVFLPDEDGIIPLTDTAWFADDAATRLIEFIRVAFPTAASQHQTPSPLSTDHSSLTTHHHLEANLTFLADNLSPKKNETSRETIRRWLCDKFFKDHHIKRYKKRPIYWLFSSGRQKAFQALVYLHRYNEGTLARMRSEYVIPLQGKMAARIETLQGDVQVATSTAHRKRLEKELTKLTKQQVELLSFDEKLRHFADKRITLDLDDGVKVNYGKFGDLLAEVKAVHGKKPEGL